MYSHAFKQGGYFKGEPRAPFVYPGPSNRLSSRVFTVPGLYSRSETLKTTSEKKEEKARAHGAPTAGAGPRGVVRDGDEPGGADAVPGGRRRGALRRGARPAHDARARCRAATMSSPRAFAAEQAGRGTKSWGSNSGRNGASRVR